MYCGCFHCLQVYEASEVIDWIDDGEGLLSWLEQARLVPADVLEGIRAQAVPGELDEVAGQARSLREWFRGFIRQRKGRPLTSQVLSELEPLNRLLERDEGFGRIAAQDHASGLAFQTMRRWRSPDHHVAAPVPATRPLLLVTRFSGPWALSGHPPNLHPYWMQQQPRRRVRTARPVRRR